MTRTRKRLLYPSLLLAFAISGLLIFAITAPVSNVSEENYAKLHGGMSLEEVTAILGPGTDRSAFRKTAKNIEAKSFDLPGPIRGFKEWTGATDGIVIQFNEAGEAVLMAYFRLEESPWERLLRWLRVP